MTIRRGQIYRERYRADRHVKVLGAPGDGHVTIQTVVRSGHGWTIKPRSPQWSIATAQRIQKEFDLVEAHDG